MKKPIAITVAVLLGTVLFVIVLVFVIQGDSGKNQSVEARGQTDQRTGIGIRDGGKAGIGTTQGGAGGKAEIETVRDKDGSKARTGKGVVGSQGGTEKDKVGGKEKIEKNKGQDEVLSRENLVKLAREAGSKYRNIPPDCKVSVRDEDTKFVVTFILELPPDTAGGDYYAKVTVDKQTSQVLQVLVSP